MDKTQVHLEQIFFPDGTPDGYIDADLSITVSSDKVSKMRKYCSRKGFDDDLQFLKGNTYSISITIIDGEMSFSADAGYGIMTNPFNFTPKTKDAFVYYVDGGSNAIAFDYDITEQQKSEIEKCCSYILENREKLFELFEKGSTDYELE